ncbi:MAG: LysM peptidoglycan-binding domain-containing protein [Chitinophagales bacterium]|nr:LysM peptidoglycan-binding domain-containing protein [Chitinophagales bacterium]
MKAKLSLLFVLCIISFGLFAQTNMTIHQVEPGQTLYFISKKYDLSIAELRANNPEIGDDLIIKPGQALQILLKKPAVKVDASDYKIHVVQSKETLFSIAKQYGIKVDDIIQMNDLANPNISIGQELRVQKLTVDQNALFDQVKTDTPKAPITESVKIDTPTNPSKSNPTIAQVEVVNEDVALYKQLFDSYNKKENTLKKDKGIGNYLEGTSSGAYLAMVNNIPAGQIVKLRNLMNNKVIYLKVVGSVPEKDAEKNISIKISKSAALDLNIIEERFLAEWTWYTLGAKSNETSPSESAPFDDF